MACLSLLPVREVTKPGHGLVQFLCAKEACVKESLWLRGLTWRVGLRLIQVARSLLVVVFASSDDARKKGGMRSVLPMCHIP